MKQDKPHYRSMWMTDNCIACFLDKGEGIEWYLINIDTGKNLFGTGIKPEYNDALIFLC